MMQDVIANRRSWHIETGDALTVLRTMPDACVQCCVTSPPYYALRDYGVDGQIGLEATPELFVAKLVEVFEEVRRVLREDGTLWLNIGDSYCNTDKWGGGGGNTGKNTIDWTNEPAERCAHAPERDPDSSFSSECVRCVKCGASGRVASRAVRRRKPKMAGLKPKDLIGVPWLLAFALRNAGWYLRSEIIWHKRSPMPESVTDRPTKAHEQVFLFAKSQRYFYDNVASAEPSKKPASPEDYAKLLEETGEAW